MLRKSLESSKRYDTVISSMHKDEKSARMFEKARLGPATVDVPREGMFLNDFECV